MQTALLIQRFPGSWVLCKGANTSNQAAGACRRAIVPSKPKHANPSSRKLALNAGAAGTQTATRTLRLWSGTRKQLNEQEKLITNAFLKMPSRTCHLGDRKTGACWLKAEQRKSISGFPSPWKKLCVFAWTKHYPGFWSSGTSPWAKGKEPPKFCPGEQLYTWAAEQCMLGRKKSSDLLWYLPVAVSDPHWDWTQTGKAYPSTWRHSKSICEARTKPPLMVFSSIKQNKAELWPKEDTDPSSLKEIGAP